jgi:hypothetical protein
LTYALGALFWTHQKGVKQMAYEIYANGKSFRFASEAEALAMAQDIFAKSGVIVGVSLTDKAATHFCEVA